MSNFYSIYGYSVPFSSSKSYSDFYSFQHEIVANSFNQAIQRFEKKFYYNFSSNWMFVIRSNDSTKTFYFDSVLKRFSDVDPTGQLIFSSFFN